MLKLSVLLIAVFASTADAWNLKNIDLQKTVSGGSKLLKATVGLSDEAEIRVGRDVAAYMAARYGVLEDEALTRYVTLVGASLVQLGGRPEIPYRFGVLKTDEINAWATPGGYIFVTMGLLRTLENEAELAGVLAHEISHVTEKHIVKAIRKANLIGAGEDLASAAGQDVDRYAKLSDFSINLLDKGLSREDELDADGKGAVLAARAGYDPAAYRLSIKRLGWLKDEATALEQFNKTHPRIEARVRVIDQSLAKAKIPPGGAALPDRFRSFVKAPVNPAQAAGN